jgi:HK97 family phage major capsid protein
VTALSVKDLGSIIKDNVEKALADKMVGAEQEARAAFDAAMKRGDPEFMRKVAQLATGNGQPTREAKLSAYGAGLDPHKGKGLGFARAVRSIAHAKRSGAKAQDVAAEWAKRGHVGYRETADELAGFEKRALEAGTLAGAGVLIPEQMSSEFIELLYAQTVATSLGARDLEFSGALTLGRLNASATVGYVGEEANITPSQPSVGAVKLTGKKAAGLVAITNELLGMPSVGADAMVRDDLLQAMALRRDLSFYRGTGAETQPKGVQSWVRAGNRFNQTGTTLSQVVGDYCQLARFVEESNIPSNDAAYVMTPRTFWGLAKLLDTNGSFVFMPMLMAGNLFGFRFAKTTQIPNNLSGSQSQVFFGVHSDVILGRDISRPLEIEMQANGAYWNGSAVVAGFSNDTTPIRIIESHDVAARHDNTFAIMDQVTLS